MAADKPTDKKGRYKYERIIATSDAAVSGDDAPCTALAGLPVDPQRSTSYLGMHAPMEQEFSEDPDFVRSEHATSYLNERHRNRTRSLVP